jgi:RHS repeat-associated protein
LEPRHLLATVVWDGGGGDFDWNNRFNWDGDTLPGMVDDVVIDVPGSEITVVHSSGNTAVQSLQSQESLTLSGGTLSLASDSSINAAATLSGGILSANGDLTITDTFDWTGGTLQGEGATVINSGAMMHIRGENWHQFATHTIRGEGLVEWTEGSLRDGFSVDVLTVLADLNVSGNLVKSLFGDGTLNLGGTTTWSGSGNIGLSGASVLRNQGLFVADTNGARIESGGTPEFINDGTLRKVGEGKATFDVAFKSHGTIELFSGELDLERSDSISLDGNAYLVNRPNATLSIHGDFLGMTREVSRFDAQGRLLFNGRGTSNAPQLLEVMGRDGGSVISSFIDNFAHGTLELDATYVALVDESDNATDEGPEALYVDSLIVDANSTLQLSGLKVYARTAQIDGNILGGTLQVLTGGGEIPLDTATSATLTNGQVDDWTFFARRGHFVTVSADPGGDGAPPPVAPALGQLNVEIVAPDGTILASGESSTAGDLVWLDAIALPDDGTYRVRVSAAASNPEATGNYVLTVGAATLDARPLVLNQRELGVLERLYSQDHWTFSARAGQVVRLDLLNSDVIGLQFQLTGPEGWIGFTDQPGDTDPITLPLDGQYVLNAYSNGLDTGSYAFQLNGLDITSLELGVEFSGALLGMGDAQLFQIELAHDSPLQVTFDNGMDIDSIEVYVGQGLPPTRREFGYRNNQRGSDHILSVPFASPGTWYVLVYGEAVSPSNSFTIRADAAPLFLNDVIPDHHATGQSAALTLYGVGFLPGSQATIIAANGVAYSAQSVGVDASNRITAVFDLTDVAQGSYDVRVTLPNGEIATLQGGVDVRPQGNANLETRVILPSALGTIQTATLYVEYANTGASAMPAPILTLQSADSDGSDRPLLTLDGSQLYRFWTPGIPDGFGHSVRIYASGAFPGQLLPGETVRVPVYYAGLLRPIDITDREVEFEIRINDADSPEPIDWQALQSSLMPSWMSEDAWEAVYANLVNQIGPTWGDYVRTLSENAVYLSRHGLHEKNVDELYNFEFQQAVGLNAVSTLATVIDASLPAPGLPLEFGRSFGNTISERYQTGPFGRGWSASWQISLEALADGTVVVQGSTDAHRRFQPDRRRLGAFFSETGDTGTLRKLGDGAYELTEFNGLVTRFHPNGTLDFVRDINGNQITAEHMDGRLSRLTHSNGASLAINSNAAGLIESIRDSVGRTVVYSYDPTNTYLLSATSPAGTATYTYSTGNGAQREHALLSITKSGEPTQHFEYDHRGRLLATFLGDDTERIEYNYGEAGRVTATDASGVSTSLFFDHRGLVVRTEDDFGNYTRYEYDGARQLIRETDTLGRSVSYAWSEAGALQSFTDQLGQTTLFVGGGPNNQPTAFIDARGNTLQYTYDGEGNLTATSYPDGTIEQFGYDTFGNPFSLMNRRGQMISRTYNAAGQITQEIFPDASTVTYTYDARDRLETTTDTQGTTTFQYDPADRLSRIEYPNGRWLEYGYDSAGRRARMEDHSGFVVQYGYDAAGRLSELSDGGDALIVRYVYDDAGRLIREDKGNDTWTLYAYDVAARIESIVHHAADGSVNSQFLYNYDSLGRRIGMSTMDGEWTYTYDPTGQLTRAVFVSSHPNIVDQEFSYEYDALGNRVRTVLNGDTTDYTANNLNQYASAGATTFLYDLDGNLVRENGPQGSRLFSYDARSQLVEVSTPEGTWQYEYDVFGNRTATVVNGVRREFLLDPTGLVHVIGEYNDAGVRTVSYAHGLGLEAAIGAADISYYDFGALGSTVGMSGTSGTYVNEYVYEPFGDTLYSVESVDNSFEFVGELGVRSEENGLYFMRARYYDAEQGRFVSQDPIRLASGDPNMYRYVGNEPVKLADPSGLVAPRSPLCQNDEDDEEDSETEPAHIPEEVTGSFLHDPCGNGGRGGGNDTTPPPYPPGESGSAGGSGSSQTLFSKDPNDKLGAAGYGSQAFIQQGTLIPYRINFENLGPGSEPTPTEPATAPAQRVEITDQLPSTLDWSTLEFTEAGFGDTLINFPAGQRYHFTVVPMTLNDQTFDVEIELSFDSLTGQVRAVFQSVDPSTFLPPDVLTGFLPPEDGTGIGRGHIGFTVQANANLPTGTEIRNVALISFDGQTMIATNQVDPQDPAQGTDPHKEALNTIDAEAPTSQVSMLSRFSPPELLIAWGGSDEANGSGIRNYDILVSIDDGPFDVWLQGTTAISMLWQGEIGRTYRFYSIATDNVGHREAIPSAADAVTRIALLGDGNLDGTVDAADLTFWLANRFAEEKNWTTGDYNRDGVTDASDFNIWNANKFRQLEPPTAAAQPSLRPIRAPLKQQTLEVPNIAEFFTTDSLTIRDDNVLAIVTKATGDIRTENPLALPSRRLEYLRRSLQRRETREWLFYPDRSEIESISSIDEMFQMWGLDPELEQRSVRFFLGF